MSSSDRPAGERVAAVLESLAAEEASGLLAIDGDPGGAIYLDRGQITFARAPGVPDVSVRLLRTLQPSADVREALARASQPDPDVGALLVERQQLTAEALGALLRSVIVDAVIALIRTEGGSASLTSIRLTPAEHWAGGFVRLPVTVALAVARARAAEMARAHLAPTTWMELRDLHRPSAVLDSTQWSVACAIGEGASARDVAWRRGLALSDVIVAFGALMAAGLCGPSVAAPPAPERTGPPGQWFTTVADPPPLSSAGTADAGPSPRLPGARAAEAPLDVLPRRGAPDVTAPVRPVMSAEVTDTGTPPGSTAFRPAPGELLGRVLSGLRESS